MRILTIEHAPNRANGIKETIQLTYPNIDVVVAQIHLGMILPDFKDFDAIIPGGGPMGVYEIEKPEYDYILREADYLKAAIDAGMPIFAICFGHQLIAHILGGTVIRDESKREIGWFSVSQNQNGKSSDMLKGLPEKITMFQYHNDRISKLPAGAIVLAESELCDVQALEYEDLPICSVQFHPEINAPMGKIIFRSTRDKLEGKGYNVDSILDASDNVSKDAGRKIFVNFIKNVI